MRRALIAGAGLLVLGAGGVALATSAAGSKSERGVRIVAVEPPVQDRPGHFVLARGRYQDGKRFRVTARRDRFEEGGIAEDMICFGLEPGPSMCGSTPLSAREPLSIHEQVANCTGTVVFGHVIAAVTRVEVAFRDGRRLDSRLFTIPAAVRRGERMFAVQRRGEHYATRVIARDRRGRVVGTERFGPRDAFQIC